MGLGLSEPFPASRGLLHSSAPGGSLLYLSSPSAGAGTLHGKRILVPVPQTQLFLGGTHTSLFRLAVNDHNYP